jgi:hypothetical protein
MVNLNAPAPSVIDIGEYRFWTLKDVLMMRNIKQIQEDNPSISEEEIDKTIADKFHSNTENVRQVRTELKRRLENNIDLTFCEDTACSHELGSSECERKCIMYKQAKDYI